MKTLYRGICHGGPLSGHFGESRFPKGFLLVDKPGNRAWIYEWNLIQQYFRVRDPEGYELSHEGRKRAAEESDYDVIAAPWEVSDGNSGT